MCRPPAIMPPRLLLSVLAFAFLVGAAGVRADVFHLRDGGAVAGKLLDTEGAHYRIRTAVGIVSVAVDAVARIEVSATPFEEYERRLAEAVETAAAQAELGQWCVENGLELDGKRHFERALELDGNCAAARRALGYVRVGGLWVDGRSRPGASEEQGAPATVDNGQRLRAAVRSRWFQRVRAIKQAYLGDSGPRWEDGRARILAIEDPLAIVPLARVLSGGDVAGRRLLVEALSRFEDLDASLSLAILALADDDREVRERAVADLVRRDDPRVAAQMRDALVTGDDTVLKRAACALGWLGVEEAVPELIRRLTALRDRTVEVPVYLYPMAEEWARGPYDRRSPRPMTRLRHTDRGLVHGPAMGNLGRTTPSLCRAALREGRIHGDGGFRRHGASAAGPLDIEAAGLGNGLINIGRRQRVVVYRTEVLDALRRITGQDFGFDVAAWSNWHTAQAGAPDEGFRHSRRPR